MSGIVEPRRPVDLRVDQTNPLLRTQLFPAAEGATTVAVGRGQRAAITPIPSNIHFGGFNVNQSQTFKLRLLNTAGSSVRMHVIAPTTPFFKIRYTKVEGGLRPGFSETIEIDFVPTEWRYYYDCIRVHVEGEGNLLIPIHGYPVPGDAAIPKQLNFAGCAIGKTVTRRIPLTCTVPIEFDFKVSLVEDHMYFDLHPMAGTIPAKGTTHITVSFTPQTYSTVTMAFEVLLSQFNAKAVRCNVLASAKPGALKEETKLELTTAHPVEEESKSKPRPPKQPKTGAVRTVKRGGPKKQLVVNNLKIPPNRRGIQWINSVMNQPAASDSLKAAQIRTVQQPNADGSGVVLPRQRVEELWMIDLRKKEAVAPDLGDLVPNEDELTALASNRDGPAEAHKVTLGVGEAVKAVSLSRRVPVVGKGLARTFREVKGDAALVAEKAAAPAAGAAPEDIAVTFDRRPGDGLRRRAYAMQRFVQAARKVIIRNRAAARVAMLMDALHVGVADEGADLNAVLAHTQDPSAEGAAAEATVAATSANSAEPPFCINDDAVDTFTFPGYENASILPVAPPREPVAVSLPQLPPPPPVFGQLVVPRQCDLLGYAALDPAPYFPLCDEDEVPLQRLSVTERFLFGENAADNDDNDDLDETRPTTVPDSGAVLDSTTATALDEVDYPQGHIFNESSKYGTTFAAIKYSEVDIDHWFNPFGLKKAMPSTVVRKAKINTSKPVYNLVGSAIDMENAGLPSATTLAADFSLSNLWVPRLTDPYLESVLPSGVPDLMTDLPAEDLAEDDDDDDDSTEGEDGHSTDLPVVTMADIYKEFYVPEDEKVANGGTFGGDQDPSAATDRAQASSPMFHIPLVPDEPATTKQKTSGDGGEQDAPTLPPIRSNVPFDKDGPISRESRADALEDVLSTRQTDLVKGTETRLQQMQESYEGVSGDLLLTLDLTHL